MTDARGRFPHKDAFNVPIDMLRVDAGFNVRIDRPELAEADAELLASIRSQGFIQSRALTIRKQSDGTALIRDGNRRFRAVQRLIEEGMEFKALPCVLAGRGNEATDTLLILTANSGLNNTPLEEAILMERLVNLGWSEADIAAKLGKSKEFVARRLNLLSMPEAVKTLIKAGRLASTEAQRTIRQEGAVMATNTLKKASEATNGHKITRKRIEAVQPPPKPPISITPYAVRVAEVWSEQTEEFRASMPDEFRLVLDALRGRVR